MAWNEAAVRRAVRLYLLADTGLLPEADLLAATRAALRGGVTMVQLRAKGATTLEQIRLARLLRNVCAAAGVPFVVNDRVDVALAAESDGVHVGHIGEEDMDPEDARRLLGPGKILGVSVGGPQEAQRAAVCGASYVSAGPMFATATKANAGPPAGLTLLRAVRGVVTLPLVVIGGITVEAAAELFAAGADGLCIGSAILRAPDPEAVARQFVAAADSAAGQTKEGVS